jgi:hypothetical protein
MTQAKDTEWFRTLVITEVEEEVLVTMAKFFMDNGWIQQETEAGFDTLIEKICEPAPWDYTPQKTK